MMGPRQIAPGAGKRAVASANRRPSRRGPGPWRGAFCLAAAVVVPAIGFGGMAAGSGLKVAQSFSPHCQTPRGVCIVPPQPVASMCLCGDTQGVIIE